MSFGKFGTGDRMEDWSRKIHDIMDQMRNRIFFEYRATGTWAPRANVFANREAYHICVELSGLERDLICVECVDAQRVRVSGRRPPPRGPQLEGPYSVELMEIDEGAFLREIDLPEPVDGSNIEVSYDRGYLWVTIPKITPT